MKQAKGSVRQLRLLPAEMVNGRGRTLTVEAAAYEWIAVFLLDHDQAAAGTVVSWEPVGMPAVVPTRRDACMTRFEPGTQAVFGSYVMPRRHEVASRTGRPADSPPSEFCRSSTTAVTARGTRRRSAPTGPAT